MDVLPLLSFSQRKSGGSSVPEAVKYWQVSKLNVSTSLTNSQSKGGRIPIAFAESSRLCAGEGPALWNRSCNEMFPKVLPVSVRWCWRLCQLHLKHTFLPFLEAAEYPTCDAASHFSVLRNPVLVVIRAALESDKALWWGSPRCSCLCHGSGGADSSSFKFLSLLVL